MHATKLHIVEQIFVAGYYMQITGSKRCSSDLEQGGLEIPAKTIFQNSNEGIIEEMKKKLAPLIEDYNKKH